ncbi:uncharacterized protein PHACADRAFT_213671 [Phanerochaete carnosa HHB-10118-sp]|uniref:Uncharacterized protein n=1 Tax=Phanerochaete carnosa (strain HHB-10118-sp) TaxID=650164 RepID=K5VHT7_PHACS|nr:uncharacterized protein PHACADRAFT_213671 [Phanerochaete carnosa HHB-10118-sp]EKM50798.1 hypothetical protein PHACADRAFT_213671 [Phanerochaete carnosa HHB-10118-sp]
MFSKTTLFATSLAAAAASVVARPQDVWNLKIPSLAADGHALVDISEASQVVLAKSNVLSSIDPLSQGFDLHANHACFVPIPIPVDTVAGDDHSVAHGYRRFDVAV